MNERSSGPGKNETKMYEAAPPHQTAIVRGATQWRIGMSMVPFFETAQYGLPH